MIHQTSDIILAVHAVPIEWAVFKAEFLAMYTPPMASRATRSKYDQVLRLAEGLGAATTADLTPELVARFIGGRPPATSPHTTRSLLMSLRAICNYAEGRRYVAISPFRLRKLSRWIRMPPPQVKDTLTREQVRRIFDVMSGDIDSKRGWARWRARRLFALTATVAFTALRRNEALFLWVEDLDLDKGILNLVPRARNLPDAADSPRLKTEASAQPVAMPSALVPILRDWLAHRLDHPEGFALPPIERIPWIFPGARRASAWSDGPPGHRPVDRLRAVARRAGVEGDVSWQTLRRTWATIAESSGMNQAMITRQCRHTSEATTKRHYQRRVIEALRDAVEQFDF